MNHLAEDLISHPLLVYQFPWQTLPRHLQLFVDTDFAGCRVTLRSTSGGVAMFGQHCLRHWSTTLTTLALSSGEAEITGLCKGAAQGLGLRSVGNDLGITYDLELLTDAAAAMGIARRLGIGKIRHVDTSLHWVQQNVRDKEILRTKLQGKEKPCDSLTKHLSGPDLPAHLPRMG